GLEHGAAERAFQGERLPLTVHAAERDQRGIGGILAEIEPPPLGVRVQPLAFELQELGADGVPARAPDFRFELSYLLEQRTFALARLVAIRLPPGDDLVLDRGALGQLRHARALLDESGREELDRTGTGAKDLAT